MIADKHPHYHKDVSHLETIDVYRVLSLFGVTDPCIQHAVKKLLVAGGRGAGKDLEKDVHEAIESLMRFQEMRSEDADKILKELEKPWIPAPEVERKLYVGLRHGAINLDRHEPDPEYLKGK